MYHPVFVERVSDSIHPNAEPYPVNAYASVAAAANAGDNRNNVDDYGASVSIASQYDPGSDALTNESVAIADDVSTAIATTSSSSSAANPERLLSRLTRSLRKTSSSRHTPSYISSLFSSHRRRPKDTRGHAPSDLAHISRGRQSSNISTTRGEPESIDPLLLQRSVRTLPPAHLQSSSHHRNRPSISALRTDVEPVSSERIVFAVVEPGPHQLQCDSTPDPSSVHSTVEASDCTHEVKTPSSREPDTCQPLPEAQCDL